MRKDVKLRSGKPAFRPHEKVECQTADALKATTERLASSGLQSVLSLMAPEVSHYAGRQFVIERVESHHLDLPLYVLRGEDYRWPETALLDILINTAAPAVHPDSTASQTYHAIASEHRLKILDFNGFCYCDLSKIDPKFDAIAANEIASIRSCLAFESIYDFDGKFAMDRLGSEF